MSFMLWGLVGKFNLSTCGFSGGRMMKRLGLLLILVITISAAVPLAYFFSLNLRSNAKEDEFFFGVTCGADTVKETELLMDRVQNFTNLFVIDSSTISNNQTALNEVCTYAANRNLNFIVYFFSLYASDWQQGWAVTANQTWGDLFLGIYLRDEPGGKQIDLNQTVASASSYSQAAEKYVEGVSSTWSMQFLNTKRVPVMTSDYALYWFDYQAGFDIIFAELGWNNSRTQQIGLCRGAATAQAKDWGAIITWTYDQMPYLENPPETYPDMLTAYQAGAKYLLMFDYYPTNRTSHYGTLNDDYFTVMEQFWKYAKTYPRNLPATKAEAALVLPKDYGWGMRSITDRIWGLWPADNSSTLIWQNLNALTNKYGLKLDIVYDGYGINYAKEYSKIFMWNQTIT
jgi:hypothetical protein